MSEKITLEVLEERLSNWFQENKEDHTEIITQTTKTNGTVTCHDRAINQLKGGLILLSSLVVPIIVAIAVHFMLKLI